MFIQYNLSTPVKHSSNWNGKISQDTEYRRLYDLPNNSHEIYLWSLFPLLFSMCNSGFFFFVVVVKSMFLN